VPSVRAYLPADDKSLKLSLHNHRSGDDTIFVIPKSIDDMNVVITNIKDL